MAADIADTDPAGTGGLAAGASGQEAGRGEPAADTATAPSSAAASPQASADAGDDHARPGISASEAVEPDPAATEQVGDSDRVAAIEFNIAVDIIYNRARASWLTLCHRVFLLGAIVAGSTAASDLASAKLCAFAAAACAALDLVFDPATGAAVYRELVRSTHDVLVDLKRHRATAAAMDEAEIALLKISGTETAPYQAQRELAFNQARLAFGRDDLPLIPIGFWRRAFAQVWRFEG